MTRIQESNRILKPRQKSSDIVVRILFRKATKKNHNPNLLCHAYRCGKLKQYWRGYADYFHFWWKHEPQNGYHHIHPAHAPSMFECVHACSVSSNGTLWDNLEIVTESAPQITLYETVNKPLLYSVDLLKIISHPSTNPQRCLFNKRKRS